VTLGLLTGNFQSGAWLKLEHYALHDYFDFGGFGDRHVNRNDVARDAFELIRRRLGADFDPADVWVVGDTPADVECARAIGANSIAVATGIFTAEELAAENPNFLWDDLADVERFLRLLSL
jgi:phosphoglycolate phosphatase-like HAD superfamily hydrolase